MATKDCLDAIIEVAPHLTRDEAKKIDDAVADFRRRKQSLGSADVDADTIRFALDQAEFTKAAALIEKRNAINNVLKSQRRHRFYDEGGLASNRIRAMINGDQRGYGGAADSVEAQGNAIEAKFIGGLFGELRQAGLIKALSKAKPDFDKLVANELARITDQSFGRDTGNATARQAAEIIHRYQEASRTMLNDAGAWIGKLPGWIVRQTHDAYRIRKAGKEAWKDTTRPLLDENRLAEIENVESYLDSLYANLASGNHMRYDQVPSAKDPAFTGPGNLGKRLSQERTIIFKNADAWFEYNQKFGRAGVLEATIDGIERSARSIALMRRFGTNPESAFKADLDFLKIRARDAGDFKEHDRLNGAAIRNRFNNLVGKNNIPGDPSIARWGAIGRAAVNMTSLGGVVLSAITDLPIRASVLRHNGVGLLSTWSRALEGFANSPQKKEIAELIGVGIDGLKGSLMSRFSATDNLPGTVAKIQDRFFRLGLLTQWTDSMKRGMGFMLSRNLANAKKTAFDALDPMLRRNLERYNIDAGKWDLIRQAETRAADGEHFLTPDGVGGLGDALFEPLVADRVGEFAGRVSKEPDAGARVAAYQTRLINEERDALETGLRSYYVDQVNEALTIPGINERSILLQGFTPGTPAGEAMRFIMQFKSFPTAFTTKHLGREILRNSGADQALRPGALAKADGIGIAKLIAGLTVMGYVAKTAKDIARGQAPADPDKMSTWVAAFAQGGGLGLYGDFILADYNRFGKGAFESLAGPGVGKAADLLRIISGTAGGQDMGPQAWRAAKGYLPNLFYTKLALDYLVLYQIQEMVSPGSLARTEKAIEERTGSVPLFKRPSSAIPTGGGSRIFEGVR